jgi:alkylation response protein AidB-like acyl-CoA dehydrogenase
MSVEYTSQREQFGKPVGSFQAVKHHLADAAVRLEFARPCVYRAAWSLANAEPGAPAAVSLAKAQASDAALLAAGKALQVHGAIGYTVEYDLHLWMKRAWAIAAAWGDAAWHRRRFGNAILEGSNRDNA